MSWRSSFSFNRSCSTALGLDEPVDQVRRNAVVVIVLGAEPAAAPGQRAEIDRIPLDLCRRDERGYQLFSALEGVGPLNPATPRVQIAENVALHARRDGY